MPASTANIEQYLKVAIYAKCLISLETLVEPIYSPSRINDFLLASIEGMAIRTNFQVNVFTYCRSCLDHVTTAASSCDFFIFRMSFNLHVNSGP